ncbi:MAG: DNA translocase FtsK, partial [Lentisphaeraceae bacterium]|nr:DNA translocase FtsK [Lentisphaeraceae bacterium]
YQATGIYCGGYCLCVVGSSMLLGTYPEFLSSICAVLNLRELPGGALGSTLCHPVHGWLTLILHPLGCTLVAISMLAIGVITIWLYDWQFYCRKLIKALKEDPMAVSLQESQKIVTESFKDKEKPYENSTVNHIMSKASTVFGWMKVKQGTQLDTLQRLEVEKKQQTLNESHSQLNMDQDTVADITPVEKVESAVADKPPRPEPTSLPVDFEPELLDEEPLPDIISGQGIDTPSTLAGGTRYKVPGFNVISKVEELVTVDQNEIARKREILQETLDSFRIKAITGNAMAGPRVTLFEIIPEKGVKVEKIANLNNNIAMELQAEKVRILAPIPGRRSVGIEVPNDDSSPVCFRSLLETKEFRNSKAMIPVILGKDIAGKAIVMDLAKAPHLLIAGATGAGKSVFMNTLILSLLYKFSPEELQLIMVDPKFVELTGYNTIPHLVCPVITDPQRVPSALRWAVFEMDCRYQMLAAVGVKHLEAFNTRKKKPNEPTSDCNGNKIPDKLPLTVIIIDELADLMMMAKKEIETSIARIAQKARAVGIHLVIATQRPSVDVVTGI